MTALELLSHSRALWNRTSLNLDSDEVLAQILDRGSFEDWRALYRLAQGGEGDEEFASRLRRRILKVVTSVPLPLPHFWLAALESLPDPPKLVDPYPPLPPYPCEANI